MVSSLPAYSSLPNPGIKPGFAAEPKPLSSPPPPPDPQQLRNNLLGLVSAGLAVGLAFWSHGKLSRCIEQGHLLSFCQNMDKRLAPLNQWLKRINLPKWPVLDKVFTQVLPAKVVKDALNPHIEGAVGWAVKHLPKEVSAEWQTLLGKANTLDDALSAIKTLKTQQSTLSLPLRKQSEKLLNSLERRFNDGLRTRYIVPYQQTRRLIEQGRLGPVGQGFLHLVQSVHQLTGGEFAGQALTGGSNKKVAVAIQGLASFAIPIYALLHSEWPDKLKNAGEELWGNAFGNFAGWYWGTQWLNHWGGVPKLLNKIKPGLANARVNILFQQATLTGLVTELLAIFGVGWLIQQLGTQASHRVFGKPRKTYTPTLPKNYKPLERKPFLSEETPLPQSARLTILSDEDLKKLMTNPHSIIDRQVASRLEPRLDNLLEPDKVELGRI